MDIQLYNNFFDDFDKLLTRRITFPLWESLPNSRLAKNPMDFTEFSDHYEINADVPGFSPEDINIEYQDNVIFISGIKNNEKNDNNGKIYLQERLCNSFSRSFKLPSNINFDQVDAKLNNGVLKVVLPKQEVIKKPSRKIQIN